MTLALIAALVVAFALVAIHARIRTARIPVVPAHQERAARERLYPAGRVTGWQSGGTRHGGDVA